MTRQNLICPINNLPANQFARIGRAHYLIEPSSGIIFQENPPTVSEMEEYVQTEYREGVYREYLEAAPLKRQTARRRLKKIAELNPPGKLLLDVGCANGVFIEAALEDGYDAYGVELSSEAVTTAKAAIRERIVLADVNSHVRDSLRTYDVITANDIVEHTQDPLQFVKDLWGALNKNGIVAVATPDTDHFLRWLMGPNWSMLQPWQHTFLFSKKAMRDLLTTVGFRDVKVMTTTKVLTLDYLAGQITETNPKLSRVVRSFLSFMPGSLTHRPMAINIGEMLALGRK